MNNHLASPPSADPAPDQAARMRETALLEMGKAFRVLAMYPAQHPQRVKLIEAAHASVMAILTPLGDLSFAVQRGAFAHQDLKLGEGQPMIRELAQEMHLRQVKSFSLKADLTVSDFSGFMELLREEPEKFRQGRFMEQWFSARRIKGVWVNEIDFSRMITAAAADREEPEDEQSGPETIEEKFQDVLNRLRDAEDPAVFSELLREAEVWLRSLIEAKDFETAWTMVKTIVKLSDPSRRPGPGFDPVRTQVGRMCEALIKGEFINRLLLRYARPDAADRPAIRTVFELVGPRVVDEALEILAQREAIGPYRPLLDLILSFEDKARDALEHRLKDQNLIAVRKSLFLLGELAGRRSIEAIRPLLSHKDPKVRRDAIKALVRQRNLEASRALVAALPAEKDQDLKLIVVQALGDNKDLAAVPSLITVINKTALNEDSIVLILAAIDALGRIGSREALPHLVKVLGSFRWFKKALGMPLRLKAAEALARLGGDTAFLALNRYAGKKGVLADKCRAELEALAAADNAGK